MISKLVLTNFKKHEALEVNFTQGLNAVRGGNENGKSSIFKAIAYAFFGARALDMSLEETVTWGKQTSTLKVELTFKHGAVTYTIVRKKSGAEISGDDGVTASGHAEVTSFVEKLFQANSAVAQATMLANQSSLQTGLDSSAMPLIEKLANMRLIDELIDKVQQKLPSGSTKGVEAQLHAVPERDKPQAPDLTKAKAEIAKYSADLQNYELDIKEAEKKFSVTKNLADEGREVQEQNAQNERLRESLQNRLAKLTDSLGYPEALSGPSSDSYNAKVQAQKDFEKIKSVYATFSKVTPYGVRDKVDIDSQIAAAQKAFSDYRASIDTGKQNLAILQAKLAGLSAERIVQTTCTFCGKDFSDVPEVAKAQAELDNQIADLNSEISELKEFQAKLVNRFKDFKGILEELGDIKGNASLKESELSKLGLLNSPYISVDNSTYPPTLSWIAPFDASHTEPEDWAKLQLEAKNRETAYEKSLAAAEAANKSYSALTEDLNTIEDEDLTQEQIEALLAVDEQYEELQTAKKTLEAGKDKLRSMTHEMQLSQVKFDAELAAYTKEVEQRALLLELLKQYSFNNAIIAKLREARPAVAAKLWALVLTGVSHYFSQIRGTQSVVTRGEKGFLIDGKGVEAFSGSTKDSLGMAIRLMLQKTFLPNVSFMLVDEPGAACDSERESGMLAVLAGSGLDQVILVTHSDLADTFAANVTQI